MIATGELGPGSKLPTERDLAREFAVNRASVRQVFKVLETMGVVTQRVGDGSYLSLSAEDILNEPLEFLILLDEISFHDLFETRMIVEPELAARAAERANDTDLRELEETLRQLKQATTKRARIEADLAFHEILLRASENRICQILFRRLHRTVATSMAKLARKADLDRPLSYHRKIYQAVAKGDADEARKLMREHLVNADRSLPEDSKHPPAKTRH